MTDARRIRLQRLLTGSSIAGLIHDRERELSHPDNIDAIEFIAMIDEELKRRELGETVEVKR